MKRVVGGVTDRYARGLARRYTVPGRVDEDDLIQEAYLVMLQTKRSPRAVQHVAVKRRFQSLFRHEHAACRSPTREQRNVQEDLLLNDRVDPAELVSVNDSLDYIRSQLGHSGVQVLEDLISTGGCCRYVSEPPTLIGWVTKIRHISKTAFDLWDRRGSYVGGSPA